MGVRPCSRGRSADGGGRDGDVTLEQTTVARAEVPERSRRMRLVLLSFLLLFVELALIRWSASNVVYLAFFTNFVLLASFLGIGVGFLRARADRNLFPLAAPALAGLVAFVLLFPVHASLGEPRFTGPFGMPALPDWVLLPILFLWVAAVTAFIAEGVARTFVTFEPLEAYRLDILGAILGIAGFSVLSFVHAPPVVWGLVSAGLFFVLRGPEWGHRQKLALAALVALLGVESLLPSTYWSPYYKVTATTHQDGDVSIRVNNIPHQSIHRVDRLPEIQPFYFFTYDRIPANPLEDVLIIGSGNGNDVAVALSQGAERVDAVEIDPVLYGIGRDRHPDRPYQNPRVEAHITDGRAFLERTRRRYDLILFALPDSLTVVGQSALRLESYLLTEEALELARDRLKPGGAFSAYNYYQPFLMTRMAGSLERVFGQPPCIDHGSELRERQQAVMTVGLDPGATRCGTAWQGDGAVAPPPGTDDYPFPYLRDRGVPAFFLVALLLILAVSTVLVRVAAGPLRRIGAYLDLFFMGTAFLLLETKHIVQFALLFGTTWFVNALVFAGILLAVLAAVEVARRVTLPRPAVLYGVLLAALAVAWVIPSPALLALPMLPRFVAATAIAFAPIFLANLVFAQRFKDVASAGTAFGANLLGAMLGGVLEYGALAVGYRALLFVVAGLYGLAFLFGRRYLRVAA